MKYSIVQSLDLPTWPTQAYQLLDFGGGRKLERFGELVLDRVSPAALGYQPHNPALWKTADVKVTHDAPAIPTKPGLPTTWIIQSQWLCLQLRLTPFGHVGLFPEHAHHWPWLLKNVAAFSAAQTAFATNGIDQRRALNLFAYTGSTSLVLARAGWHVTHVDASSPSVAWARTNADLSQLSTASIRWIVEDARTYVAREMRRRQQYDLIVLDPPSYGHGPKGRAWQIERDLDSLLEACGQLLAPAGRLLLTAHSESTFEIQHRLPALWMRSSRMVEQLETGRMSLRDCANRVLDCGWYARTSVK